MTTTPSPARSTLEPDPRASYGRVHITAHRGDSARHRENTLPAIRSAVEAGASAVEVDIRLTVDGEVVLLHDETFDRLWGVDARVSELTWPEIQELGGAGRRIPLLSQALDLMAGEDPLLLIDLDDASPAAAAHAVVTAHAAAGTAGPPARVAWCGDATAMQTIRDLDASAEIWMPWMTAAAPLADDLTAMRPTVLNMPHLFANRALVDAAHALGMEISCWTVDDAHQAQHLIDIGVDHLTTNRPADMPRSASGPPATSQQRSSSERARARSIARTLAREAVDTITSRPVSGIDAKQDPADLATDIDRSIERRVREVIGAQFPEHAFVGEEYGGIAMPGVPCWYLDPVDGTANLANGLPWTSFSLALVEDGVPVVGVVADPWRNTILDAVAGEGAWIGDRRLTLPARDRPAETTLSGTVVCTELANQHPWPGLWGLVDGLAERFCTTRIMGSGTLSIAGVALGQGAGAVINSFGPEDHLAAVLIVREAGGVVLDEDGLDTLFPAHGGVLAARDRSTAEELLAVWKRNQRFDAADEGRRNLSQ